MQKQIEELTERLQVTEERVAWCIRRIQEMQNDMYGNSGSGGDDQQEVTATATAATTAEAKEEGEAKQSRGRSRSRSRKRSHRDRDRGREHDEGQSVYVRWPDKCKTEPFCEKYTPEWKAACALLKERFAPYARKDGIDRIYLWENREHHRMIARIAFRDVRDFGRALDASAELKEKYDYLCSNRP